jgi:hypothetical protein
MGPLHSLMMREMRSMTSSHPAAAEPQMSLTTLTLWSSAPAPLSLRLAVTTFNCFTAMMTAISEAAGGIHILHLTMQCVLDSTFWADRAQLAGAGQLLFVAV